MLHYSLLCCFNDCDDDDVAMKMLLTLITAGARAAAAPSAALCDDTVLHIFTSQINFYTYSTWVYMYIKLID